MTQMGIEGRMYIYRQNSNQKFHTPEHLNYLIWAYSAICAACFAFFLALLSASSNTILFQSYWIKVSIFSYALSFTSSLFTLLTIVTYKEAPKTLHRVLFQSPLQFIAGFSVWISVIATFCLISYFSLAGATVGTIVLWGSMILLKSIFKHADFDEKEVEERLPKIDS